MSRLLCLLAVVSAAFAMPMIDQLDVSPCLLLQSNLQQFLNDTGLDPTLTYKDGPKLTTLVNGIISKTTGVDGLVKVCNARQKFYNGMGRSYEMCINRIAIYGLGDTTIVNARFIEHLFRQLQFECAGGFPIWADNRACIILADSKTNCLANFNGTLYGTSTSNFCTQNMQDMLNCVQSDYKTYCPGTQQRVAGWFACERERLGWAADCTTLVCDTNA